MLNKSSKFIIPVVAVLALTACQSTPTGPVIAKADNTFETMGVGATKAKAQQSALDNAKKSCGFKQPIVIKDTLTYNGVVDEKTGRVIEQGVGVLTSILGTKSPNLSRDDDYEYHISFKCQ